MNGQQIHCIRFADDVVLLSESENDMNHMLQVLSNKLSFYKLKINSNKTKCITICKKGHIAVNIKIGNDKLNQVKEFCYLGSIITGNNKSKDDMKRRIMMAKQVFQKKYNLLTSKHLKLETRKRFIKTFVWSVLTYGCETWTIGKYEKERLKAAEMWMWRKMTKTKWIEKKSNERVLAEVKEKRYFIETIMNRKITLVGHVLRHNKFLTNIFEGEVRAKEEEDAPDNLSSKTSVQQ